MKRTFTAKIFLLTCFTVLQSLPAFAFSEREVVPALPQQVLRQNGVLVSRPHPVDKRFSDMLFVNRIGSVEQYARWVARNFRYARDAGADAWAAPEEMLARRTGDCEDFAFMHEVFLKRLGVTDVRVLAMSQRSGQHAVCVFKYRGAYAWFDNGNVHWSSAASLRPFIRQLSERYHARVIAGLDRAARSTPVLFRA